MRDAWRDLVEAGVPEGAPHARARFDHARVRAALSDLGLDELTEGQRDALVAWLRALRSHFPADYAALVTREPSLSAVDEGRVIKLRRIALANLAALI